MLVKAILILKSGKKIESITENSCIPWQLDKLNEASSSDFIQVANCIVRKEDLEALSMEDMALVEIKTLSEKV